MRLLRPAFVAVTVAVLVPLAPSPAGAAEPFGLPCGYTIVDHLDGDEHTAELNGGPIVLGRDAAGLPVSGSVTCSLHVNGSLHSDPAAASATSEVTPGVVLLAPTPVSFTAGVADTVEVCTRVDVAGGGTYYWNPDLTGQSPGSWSTDPDSSCAGFRGGSNPLWILDPVFEALDALICPVLALAFPPHGDVAGIWDCPPYGS